MTTYYEQQPGESAEAAAGRTGAAPDLAPAGEFATFADVVGPDWTAPLRQAIQHLGAVSEPTGWLADIDVETEREAGV